MVREDGPAQSPKTGYPPAAAEISGGGATDNNSRQDIAQLSPKLGVIALSAVKRTQACLEGLSTRDDDETHDRGARSAEALMRVAKSALSLREQIERLVNDNGECAKEALPFSAEDAERLARAFERELERTGPVNAGETETAASALPEGGAS